MTGRIPCLVQIFKENPALLHSIFSDIVWKNANCIYFRSWTCTELVSTVPEVD